MLEINVSNDGERGVKASGNVVVVVLWISGYRGRIVLGSDSIGVDICMF